MERQAWTQEWFSLTSRGWGRWTTVVGLRMSWRLWTWERLSQEWGTKLCLITSFTRYAGHFIWKLKTAKRLQVTNLSVCSHLYKFGHLHLYFGWYIYLVCNIMFLFIDYCPPPPFSPNYQYPELVLELNCRYNFHYRMCKNTNYNRCSEAEKMGAMLVHGAGLKFAKEGGSFKVCIGIGFGNCDLYPTSSLA